MRGFVYPGRGGNNTHARKTAAHTLQIVDEDGRGGLVGRSSSRGNHLRPVVHSQFISAIKSVTSPARISSSLPQSPGQFPQPGPTRQAQEESRRAFALPPSRESGPHPALFLDGCNQTPGKPAPGRQEQSELFQPKRLVS